MAIGHAGSKVTDVTPRDTDAAARAAQFAAFRRMSPAERARLAVQMSDEARAVTEAGMRRRHPDWTSDRVRAEVSKIVGAGLQDS